MHSPKPNRVRRGQAGALFLALLQTQACGKLTSDQHQSGRVNRREFMTLIGSAAVWPLAARFSLEQHFAKLPMFMGRNMIQ